MWHGHILYTEQNKDLMEGGKIRDEVGENGGNAGDELGVDEPDAADPNYAEPVDGDLVLHVELVLLEGAVVPRVHDGEEDEGEGDRDPRALEELYEGGREVEGLDRAEEEYEGEGEKDISVPAQDDDEGHEARRDEHDGYNGKTCVCVCVCRVPKSNSNSQTEDHQSPVDFGNVNLAAHFRRSVNNFDPREAAECTTLLNYGKSPGYNGLASHNSGDTYAEKPGYHNRSEYNSEPVGPVMLKIEQKQQDYTSHWNFYICMT
ncbi:nucleoside diphosphate kinase, partial [Striga asiatica]